MNLEQLQKVVAEEDFDSVRCVLPDGKGLAPHFHVTEIGKVTKDFVDCGGQSRVKTTCVLQTWVAEDVEHRLRQSKLQAILAKAQELEVSPATEIEVEVQHATVAIYALGETAIVDRELDLHLKPIQTQCLAPDRCQVPSLGVLDSDCSGTGCC